MPTRADRHIRAMRLAQECAALGARIRSIQHITGVSPREVQRFFFPDPQTTPRGRTPNSLEWYHTANLLDRAESSIFISIYRRLRSTGFGAGETLVCAYRGYQAICQCPHRISFDRAFDLASHTDGIWLAHASVFEVLTCPHCRCEYLAALGASAHTRYGCPFCRLLQRYDVDPRLQSSFPARSLASPTAAQVEIMALFCSHRKPPDDKSPPE